MRDHVEEELIKMKHLSHCLADTKIEVKKEVSKEESNTNIAVPKSLYLQEVISPESIDLACDEDKKNEIRKHFRVIEKIQEPISKQNKQTFIHIVPNILFISALIMTLVFQMIQANTLRHRGIYQTLEVCSCFLMIYGYLQKQKRKGKRYEREEANE